MIGSVFARALLAAAVILAAASEADAQAPLTANLTSSVLAEGRAYTVHLPDGYARDTERRYPVVYVLDGPPLDDHTAQGARPLAAGGQAPGLIVVGIPNMQRSGRARDFLPPFLKFARRDGSPFTGGADRFLRFLREELVPRIERDYRTTRPRLLVGHSLGAIFVSYSVGAAPAFFDTTRDELRLGGAKRECRFDAVSGATMFAARDSRDPVRLLLQQHERQVEIMDHEIEGH